MLGDVVFAEKVVVVEDVRALRKLSEPAESTRRRAATTRRALLEVAECRQSLDWIEESRSLSGGPDLGLGSGEAGPGLLGNILRAFPCSVRCGTFPSLVRAC
jgi:hypothetical protein